MHTLLHNRTSHTVGRFILGGATLFSLFVMFTAGTVAGFFGGFAALCVANGARLKWKWHIEPCNDGTTTLLKQLYGRLERLVEDRTPLLLPPVGLHVQLRVVSRQSGGFLLEEQAWGEDESLRFRFYGISHASVRWCGFTIPRPLSGPLFFPAIDRLPGKLKAREVAGLLNNVAVWQPAYQPHVQFDQTR